MINTPDHFVIGSKWMKKLWKDDPVIQERCSGDKDTDVLLGTPPVNYLDSPDLSKDKDVLAHFKSMYGSKTELHHIPDLYISIMSTKYIDIAEVTLKNIYFTLKASHVPWDKIHQEKTFYDLYLMSERGCKIVPNLYYKLNNYWTDKFGPKWRADFTKESSDFFDDAVSREHVHDELHEKVKFFEKPAFKYLQEEGQTTVYVDETKFYNATEDLRRAVIIEEARVLAIERFLGPGFKRNEYICYRHFIKALVERMAPLWMTIYIVNNLFYFFNIKNNFYETI